MPEHRRLYRRVTNSALPGRLIAHLTVMALVSAAAVVGVAGSSSGNPTSAPGFSFLNLVSSVRGAGDQPAPPNSGSTFELRTVDETAFVNRGAPAFVPEAMPTPVPLDADATPLPAPGAASAGVTAIAPTSRGTAPVPAIGGLVWPVPAGSVSQGFHGGHLAIDIAANYGSQVLAAQSGVVVSAGWRNNGGGYVIEIDHGNGMHTVYNHLGSIWVTNGQSVFAGQGIGGVGCTGLCTGPHVHFVVMVNGAIMNPQRYY